MRYIETLFATFLFLKLFSNKKLTKNIPGNKKSSHWMWGYLKIHINNKSLIFQFSLVQSLSHVRLFVTPWIAARQASLSITNSRSSPKPMSIESVMPSNHLILCRPLLLLPPIPPSTRVFSNESALHIRWPNYWSSASVLPMKTQDWSPLGWTGCWHNVNNF